MGELLDRVVAPGTLSSAWDRVRENAGAPGVDGVTVREYGGRLRTNLRRLRDSLHAGTYRPNPLRRVYIDKTSGGKRALSIPTVRDRVAQEAAVVVLAPILEPEFEDCSYGYRRGRSVQQAVARIEAYRDEGYTWLLDADIDAFFDSVDHDLLVPRLKQYVKDPELIGLIRRWLTASVRDGNRLVRSSRGLSQGGPISPLLANVFLDGFDEQITKRGFKLVRYADDFIVLCKRKPRAEKALQLTRELLGELHLALDAEKTRITDFSCGFRYLGTLFLRGIALKSPRRRAGRAAL